MMIITDALEQFSVRDEQQEREAKEKLPRCCECDDLIYDEFYYDINGEKYCEECVNELFRRSNEYD